MAVPLKSGSAADYLVGAAGNDHFVFTPGNGQDTIGDFTHAADVVVLQGFAGIANFSDLQPHMAQVGADTVITFDATDSITLSNVQMTQLNAGDFLFS